MDDYMDPKPDLNRFKKMRRGDIWRDRDGDLILIKDVYRGWEKDKKSIKWVCVEAIILTANSPLFVEERYYPGQLIEDYLPAYIMEKVA